MARPLKVYTAAEFRDSFLSGDIARLVGTGPHRQGTFYVAGHTKVEALARLRELGMYFTAGKLRAVPVHRLGFSLGALFTVPGDFAAWMGGYDRPVVRVPARSTEPVVAAHWRHDPDPDPRARRAPVLRFVSEEQ